MAAELTTAARARLLPLTVALAVIAVALQIAYPLVHGAARDHLTVLIVLAFALTWAGHAVATRGLLVGLAMLVITAVGGFAAEAIGVHIGVPFGAYSYTGSLGPRLFGVPVLIGLAWTMLAWPAAVVARRLVTAPAARVAVGAWALATADLFLDPQQVAAGLWRWRDPAPHLPGVPHVPLTNYAGWLLVALVLSAAAQTLVGTDADDRLPIALYLWLYVGWIIALGAFLDLPAAAAWGALGMGTVAVPLALRVLR